MATSCDLASPHACAADPGARPSAVLDRVAILLSSLCLVHCVALPILIALLPTLAFLLPPLPWLHPALLCIALPPSGFALWRGWRAHRLVAPARFGATGLTVLASALFAHGLHPFWDAALTVGGGLLVATGHVLNWRGLRRPALYQAASSATYATHSGP